MQARILGGIGVILLFVWGAVALPGGTPGGGAGVNGAWRLRVMLGNYGSGSAVFRQEGERLMGTFTGPPAVRTESGGWDYASAPLSGTVRGNRIQFWVETPQGRATYAGTVNDAGIQGTCEYERADETCTWQAWRRRSVWGL